MTQFTFVTVLVAGLLCASRVSAQDDDYARQVAQERRQAESEAPQLAEVLGLQPGVTVADIGTGGGAMAMVLGRLVGPGRVYATDVTQRSLTTAREYARKEGLTNITVIEGGAASTNLPNDCCDALFLRNVYNQSRSRPRSTRVSTRRPSRAHGLPSSMRRRVRGRSCHPAFPPSAAATGPGPVVIDELTAAGFVHVAHHSRVAAGRQIPDGLPGVVREEVGRTFDSRDELARRADWVRPRGISFSTRPSSRPRQAS